MRLGVTRYERSKSGTSIKSDASLNSGLTKRVAPTVHHKNAQTADEVVDQSFA